MARVHDSIEIAVEPETVYAYWTQFEAYPEFLTGIEEVRDLGDGRLHWRGFVNGNLREWETEVVEVVPDTRLAWNGPQHVNDMVVDVHPTDFGSTRITIEAELEPAEPTADAVAYLEAATRRLHLDLERFRERLLHELPPAREEATSPPPAH
ncbi:MAG: SRPBCC family protein [Thiohalomonadaceae bacterium]